MILIAGAGCAGLSLAVHLLAQGYRERIALFDPRTTFERDRTFCFFDVEPHPFSDVVTHRWSRVRVQNEARTIEPKLEHAYCHLPGDVFYREALRRLEAAPNVELHLGTSVENIEDRGDHVVIDGKHRGALAFDGRRRMPPLSADDVALSQQFVGWFVETEAHTFEPGVATLMDFRVSQSRGIHFVYVLPFSETSALIEDTYFVGEAIDQASMEQTLRCYLARIGVGAHRVIASERGAIPMTTASFPLVQSPRIHNIGIGGGLARPSTGYAFLAIQRQSRALAHRIVEQRVPEPVRPYSRRAEMLDRVFLSFLARSPERAPEMFTEMFAALPSDLLVRFLCDASLPFEELRVMHALSGFPLALEAIRTPRRWLKPMRVRS